MTFFFLKLENTLKKLLLFKAKCKMLVLNIQKNQNSKGYFIIFTENYGTLNTNYWFKFKAKK